MLERKTGCVAGLLLSFTLASSSFAQDKEIAITIDDLPFVASNSITANGITRTHDRFMKIVQSLVDHHVPATGFVIAGAISKDQWELLEAFRKEGFELGNHTYSHADLNRMASDKYIDEIARADRILSPVMTQPKYFRYPYLAEGKGLKKQQVQDYLASNQYTIAPVSIDSKDYQFNERLLHISWRERDHHVAQIKQQYLDYIWRQTLRAEKSNPDGNSKQLLLLHANLLNSHCLGDVLQMYQDHGYRFISLKDALSNSKPKITEAAAEADKTW